MDNPLIDLGKLSEPLTKLVEVTAAGIGKLYAPFGTVRQANADARAKIIHASADVEIMTIEQRAKFRLEHREALRQENIEKIVKQAAIEMPTTVSEKSVDKDWILQFFDHAQDVCDDDMQTLWARILAGEVSTPETYSKRTLQTLKTLDKQDAEKFTGYCSFAFQHENSWGFFIEDDVTREMMIERLGNFLLTAHFSSIGLLSTEVYTTEGDKWGKKKIRYFNDNYEIVSLAEPQPTKGFNSLFRIVHYRHFSQTGQELFKIAGAKPIENYPERLSAHLEKEVQVSLVKQL